MAVENLFLFVVWSKARAFDAEIRAALARRFRIVREAEVRWPWWEFPRKLREFYGFGGWFTWWNKARKCGRGPFKVYVIRDPGPVWTHRRDLRGEDLRVDAPVYELKQELRRLTGHSNIVHSSVTPEESAEQFARLFPGESLDALGEGA